MLKGSVILGTIDENDFRGFFLKLFGLGGFNGWPVMGLFVNLWVG